MAQVFDPRSGNRHSTVSSQYDASTPKHRPLPSTPRHASTSGMLFQQTVARPLNDIELDYQALYLDPQKEQRYRRAKARPDWETAWHAKVACYPNRGRAIYAAILRYCPEAAEACPGGNYVAMPRRYLDAAATKATMAGDLITFKPLVRVGADLSFDALGDAALNGHDNIVEFLLNPVNHVRLNPNHRYSYCGSSKLKGELTHVIAINSAAIHAHVSTMKLLVKYGAYLSATDSRGNNALNALLYNPRLEAATSLINFYGNKKSLLPCEVIDYENVSYANKNFLSQVFHAMHIAHIDLMYDLCDALAAQRDVPSSSISSKDVREISEGCAAITALLQPWIALCQRVQEASALSPVVGNLNPRTQKASRVPVATYGDGAEYELRLGYVQDLALASPTFVKSIAEQGLNSLNSDVNNFCACVAELELSMPTLRMQ